MEAPLPSGGGGGGDDWWRKFEDEKNKKPWETTSKAPKVKALDMADGYVRIGTVGGKPVFIEPHQGKHRMKGWPGYTAKIAGPYFLENLVSPSNAPLFVTLIQTDLFKNRATDTSKANKKATNEKGMLYFDFGKSVCGSKGETSCQLQWVEDEDGIYIHGCPDPKGKTWGDPTNM